MVNWYQLQLQLKEISILMTKYLNRELFTWLFDSLTITSPLQCFIIRMGIDVSFALT